MFRCFRSSRGDHEEDLAGRLVLGLCGQFLVKPDAFLLFLQRMPVGVGIILQFGDGSRFARRGLNTHAASSKALKRTFWGSMLSFIRTRAS